MYKHGGYFGKDENTLDFSVNINPLGLSPNLRETLIRGLDHLTKYPEIDGISASEKLAKTLNLDVANIVMGNGATELIYLFARTIRAKKVMIVQPTFTEYERAFRMWGSEVLDFQTTLDDDFEININRLMDDLEKFKPNVLVICNPNNPTGTFIDIEKIMSILDVVSGIGGYAFIDESFIDFTNGKSFTLLINQFPIFLLRSMTKFYAIPGLRLGYGIGNEEIIMRLKNYKEPWTINGLSLLATKSLLDDKDYIKSTKMWYRKEKEYLFNSLKDLYGLKVFPSEANYFLFKLYRLTGALLQEQMLKKGLFLRTCEDFKGLDDTYVRVAVKNRNDNDRLVRALGHIL